jgi:hypothetical protein
VKTGQKVGLGIAAVAGVLFIASLLLPISAPHSFGAVSWANQPRLALVVLHSGSGWAARAWDDIWLAAIRFGVVAAIGGVIYVLAGKTTEARATADRDPV